MKLFMNYPKSSCRKKNIFTSQRLLPIYVTWGKGEVKEGTQLHSEVKKEV